MKVLVATSSFPRFEGDYFGNFIFNLCEKLASLGVRIKVLAPRSSLTKGRLGRIQVERFSYMPSKKLETIPNNTLKYLPLKRSPELLLYAASAYLKICREKTDLIHAHFALPMGLLCASTLKDIPLLVTCHGSDCTLPLERQFYRPFVKQVFNRADRIVAVSEFIKCAALELGAEKQKIEVIYQGVDVEKFHPSIDKKSLKEQMDVPRDSIVIGTLGRIVPEKNMEDFIKSASMISNSLEAYFLIGGEGSLRPKLEKLADKQNLRNIKFLGEVRDALKFHQICDVFVLTSTREGLSVALQEAMATGSVPVAVDGYGCPEIIKNGWNGYLFKPRNIEDMANKIYLAAHNPGLGLRARRTILEKFNIDENVKRYVELYGELI